MDGEAEASAKQRKWEATTSELHAQLRALIPLIPAMKIDEVKTLVNALDDAMWMEFRAGIIDKRAELEQARPTRHTTTASMTRFP
jgi:hypothetical protein